MKYKECVFVVLVIQHAKRMCSVIMLSVAPLASSHFCTLSQRRHNFCGEMLSDVKHVFSYSLKLMPETFLILRFRRETVTNLHTFLRKIPVILDRL